MPLEWVAFGYTWKGVDYWPDINSFVRTISWMRRGYPVASTPGNIDDPTPGLRSADYVWAVQDDSFGGHISETSKFCHDHYDNTGVPIVFCTSYYANGKAVALGSSGDPSNRLYFYSK